MEEIINEKKCCGCHACFNICPQNAITMVKNYRGFLQPVINQEKCVNCGMCKKVCPILNRKESASYQKVYACYNKDITDRINSSSGGIFLLFAKEIIKRNGMVFGASFDENFNVNHICVDNLKDLKKLMGSKYVQSTIGDTYKKVKKYLEQDKYVLFTGTPCQIEGLKSYLLKDYEKLFTQDIICHGVPSPMVWRKYLEYQEKIYKEPISSVSFRNKDNGWTLFQMKILFDKKTYCKSLKEDLFMRAFLNNVCLRSSCYDCSFKGKNRCSDITLGDYWGINNIHNKMQDNNGISLLVIHSKKGLELFNYIKESIIFEESNLDEAIKYNSAMISSVAHNKNEIKFINDINKIDFDKLVNKYCPKQSILNKYFKKIKKTVKFMIKKL